MSGDFNNYHNRQNSMVYQYSGNNICLLLYRWQTFGLRTWRPPFRNQTISVPQWQSTSVKTQPHLNQRNVALSFIPSVRGLRELHRYNFMYYKGKMHRTLLAEWCHMCCVTHTHTTLQILALHPSSVAYCLQNVFWYQI